MQVGEDVKKALEKATERNRERDWFESEKRQCKEEIYEGIYNKRDRAWKKEREQRRKDERGNGEKSGENESLQKLRNTTKRKKKERPVQTEIRVRMGKNERWRTTSNLSFE